MRELFAVTAISAMLAACGGGSGGGSSPLDAYDFVLLNADNAQDTANASFSSVSGASSDTGSAITPLESDQSAALSAIEMAKALGQDYVFRSKMQARATQTATVNCSNGGTFSATVDGELFRAGGWAQITYNDCKEGEETLSGGMRLDVHTASDLKESVSISFQSLNISDASGVSSLIGALRFDYEESGSLVTESLLIQELSLVSTVDGTTVLSDLNIQTTYNSFANSVELSMAYVVGSDDLDGKIQVSTIEPMIYQANAPYPQSGKYRLSGANGSYVSIDADSGSSDTATMTTYVGASVSSKEVYWSQLAGGNLNEVAGL